MGELRHQEGIEPHTLLAHWFEGSSFLLHPNRLHFNGPGGTGVRLAFQCRSDTFPCPFDVLALTGRSIVKVPCPIDVGSALRDPQEERGAHTGFPELRHELADITVSGLDLPPFDSLC